jgi:hypothetical protein
VQAVKPEGCIMQLPFAVGVNIADSGLRSIHLQLHRLGYCVSPDEVTRYKQSIMQLDDTDMSQATSSNLIHCTLILVLHALGGCDSTSAIFGFGKGKIFKKVSGSKPLHEYCRTLQTEAASLTDVCFAGIQLLIAIYGGSSSISLQELRYSAYCSSSLSRRFQPERLPPSDSAARLHCMRVHLQAVIWGTLGDTALKPCDWGWEHSNGQLMPKKIDGPVAPDFVLNVIRCRCKGNCASSLCSCRKNSLHCVTACSFCHGTECENALTASVDCVMTLVMMTRMLIPRP